jgi:hypothetical protein
MVCCAQVITTRSYDDRLRTIANVREAGLSVCSGGILGLGEVQSPSFFQPFFFMRHFSIILQLTD